MHVLTGKIYKKLENPQMALRHFNLALELDPKDANMVKSMIDKIGSKAEFNEDADL